jgi:UDP-N-acetylglucosamine 2-epimerase (non-hydrolysing)
LLWLFRVKCSILFVKVLFVFGTRPEAIKMAPVIRAARNSPNLNVRVCVTGQHRDLLDQVLAFFCLCPDHDLAVMDHNQDLNSLTARILSGMRPVLLMERPDLVLVQGDTVSAFAGSLAAFFERIPVGHIEAGLRTSDISSPFPEEAMRQMITRLGTIHFAPTEGNAEALRKEGVPPRGIHVTGNPGIDAVLWTRSKVRKSRVNPLASYVSVSELRRIEQSDRMILVTAHRRENFGPGLGELCKAVTSIAEQYPHTAIVFPVHPNPNVHGPVHAALGYFPNVFLLRPVDYPAFVYLMDASSCIITDSGGVQEEAPALGKPLIVTRANTERTESLLAGVSCLAGTDVGHIVGGVDEILRLPKQTQAGTAGSSPFGDGLAAERIVQILEDRALLQDRGVISLEALIGAVGWPSKLSSALSYRFFNSYSLF